MLNIFALISVLMAAVIADVGQPFLPHYNRHPYQQYHPQTYQQYYQPAGQVWAILRQNQDISPDGTYQWDYQTQNGITAQEANSPKVVGQGQVANSVRGSYSYTAPDGQQVVTNYIADENGFRVTGSHVDESIQRALAYIAPHAQP